MFTLSRVLPLLALSLLVGLAGCGGGGGGGSSSTPPSNAVTLKGSALGTASAPAGKFSPAGASLQPMAVTYSQYELFCVTFTNPPNSGSGTFDSSGNFSVTVNNAAGVPVGCFIVDTSNANATVATVTFTIGSAGGMNTGTTTGPVMAAGIYNVSINFNVTTGVATATVTGASAGGGSSSIALSDLAGSWQMYCDMGNTLPDLAACGRNLGGLSIPELFLDPISATDSVQGTLYALGAWPGYAAFKAAGNTEGLAMTLPGTITSGPTSAVVPGTTPGTTSAPGPTPSPTAKFPGFTGATFGKYDYNTNTMLAADVWTFLTTLTVTDITNTANGSWVDPACYAAVSPIVAGWSASAWPGTAPTFTTQAQKQCLLQAISVAADKDRNNALTGGPYYIPRPLGSNWNNYAGVSSTATTLVFDNSQVAGSPRVSPRFGLLGLQLSGNSATANESATDSWTQMYWNGVSSVTDNCTEAHYTNINLVKTGTGTFDGYFSTGESRQCSASGSTNSNSNFKVKFVRPGVTLPFGSLAPITQTVSTTSKPLDRTWERCWIGTPDARETMAITGGTIVYARTSHSTTNGTCGYGELGSLQAVIVGTLATGAGPTKVFGGGWSNDSAAGQTAPNMNGSTAITLTSASEVMATVTANYAAAGVTGIPAVGTTHGFLFLMDDTTTGGNPVKLYTDTSSPGASCGVDPDGYAKCMDILPMTPRN